MSKKMLLVLALLSVSSLSAQAECAPILGDTREVGTVVPGTEISGKAAEAELRASRTPGGSVHATVDLFGRELSVVTQRPTTETDSLEKNDAFAMSRIDRYCSQSNSQDAKCVSVCVRWSSYRDERI